MKKGLILFLIPFGFQFSFAVTYYVAPAGNNGNTGTSITTPFRTINYAVGKLSAGDTAYIRGGTYNEAVSISRSGTAGVPITVAAYQQELPVIDGTNLSLSQWSSILYLGGNYIHFSGLEVRNANWQHAMGVYLEGHHNQVSRLNVHHIQETGIAAKGDYSIVEYCRVWQAALLNCREASCPVSPYPNGGWASGLSACRDPQNGITDSAVLRGNIVYNNWGEGLSTFEANGTIMEDNIIYDNWATNTYVSDAQNVVFRRNMVYVTLGSVFGAGTTPIVFTLADEVASKPRSQGNIIVNNLFYGANINLFSWTLVSGSGLTGTLFANNTIVNGQIRTGNINTNSRIMNNIVDNASSVANVPGKSGLTFSHNLWSMAPPANASGAGDKIGNPNLAKTGTVTAGVLSANYFKIPGTSLALNSASSLPEIAADYFGMARGTQPDIGAHEYVPGTSSEIPSCASSPENSLSVYPNPFNPTVNIRMNDHLRVLLRQSNTSNATARVYDVNGRMVADVSSQINNSVIVWNAMGAVSGVYMVKITAGNMMLSQKFTMSK